MEMATVTTRGRIVIPARIRKQFGVKKGTKLAFIERDGTLILQPLDENYFLSMAGILGTDGKMLKSLMEDKKREQEL